jgi:hypothetical protein
MQTVCLKKSKQQVNVCPIGSALLVDIRQTLSESLAYSESTLLGNQIRKCEVWIESQEHAYYDIATLEGFKKQRS